MLKKIFTVCVLAIALAGCAPNLSAGYRALYLTERAAETFSAIAAVAIKAKADACAANKSVAQLTATAEYNVCMAGVRKLGKHWVTKVKPAVNTAMAATYHGLEVARKAKAECSWETTLSAAACGLVLTFEQWLPFLSAQQKAQFSPMLAFASIFVCQ